MDHASPDRGSGREPAINLPPLVALACLALLGIHAVRAFLPDATETAILVDGSFIPGRWSLALGLVARGDVVGAAAEGASDPDLAYARQLFASYLADSGAPGPWTVLSYALLHGSWLHVGLNCVWLAAFGSPVVRRVGTGRSIVLALATAIGGALAHWLANPLGSQPMIGASAAVSGFMAAAATFVFNRSADDPLFDHPERRRRASLAATFRNRGALMFLGSWLVINIAFGLLAQPLGIVDAGIAWEAHIGGLVVGLLLFPLLDRGGAHGTA